MRNEEIEKWENGNTCAYRTVDIILAEIMEIDRRSWWASLMLVVWPARLLTDSWLMAGISNCLLEWSNYWVRCWLVRQGGSSDYRGKVWLRIPAVTGLSSHSHQQFWIRASGGEWLGVSIPRTCTFLSLSTLSPLTLWTRNWWQWEPPHCWNFTHSLPYSHNRMPSLALPAHCALGRLDHGLTGKTTSPPVCLPRSAQYVSSSSFLHFPISSFLIPHFPFLLLGQPLLEVSTYAAVKPV